MSELKSNSLPFRPRARLLLLLGDQLIRDPGIAVFELVKNAYDADSPNVIITMSNLSNQKNGMITIDDSGVGMDYDTVTNIWLEPGTDYRTNQRDINQRTPVFNRFPIGEKGIGRFAAHKLGTQIRIITRKKNNPEVLVEIDWDDFKKEKYLDDVPVKVEEREPQLFKGQKSGTRIEIKGLRNVWDKRMVRELSRAITSICSPFENIGDFKPEFVLTDQNDWLNKLMTVEEVLEYSLFRARCDIKNDPEESDSIRLFYDYEFVPLPGMLEKVSGRKVSNVKVALKKNIPNNIAKQIGDIHIDFFIFDRDPKILSLGVTDKKGLRVFLDESGGIRVYRGGVRVYDYGEKGNDWLDLGGQRVNVPSQRISNNLVVGAVSLEIENSPGLVEKTNREGFVDNDAFRVFKDAVSMALSQIQVERNIDKKRIRNAYGRKKVKEPVLEDLTKLRAIVEKHKLTGELGSYLDNIEADFILIRDRFLTSASAGLSLAVVIHEVEKGLKSLSKAVIEEQASQQIRDLAKHLVDLVEGFASLIRKSGLSNEKAKSLISQAVFNTELRLKMHKIEIITNSDQGDFDVKCSKRLTISTLMNLIDNSIWWLDNKWGELDNKKKIYIGISKEFNQGHSIVVADNGPGFLDPPEYLIEPFISRKPDGMGLGLHLADQVMKAQGGQLLFPEPEEIKLPKGFDGAIVALVFGGTKN